MGGGGKAAVGGHLGEGVVGLHDFSLRIEDTGRIDILVDGPAGVFLEFTAEIILTDVEAAGQFVQTKVFHVMVGDVLDDLNDAGFVYRGI